MVNKMNTENETAVSVLYAIKNQYGSFSEKERLIADFIIEHKGATVDPSITELAAQIGISEATLVRFVKKLGYQGYQKFRIALARESAADNAHIFEIAVDGDEQEEDVIDRIFKHTIQALESSRKLLDKKAVIKAAELMTTARHLLLFGFGGSNVNARDAYHKLLRTGLACMYTDEFHMQLMLASQACAEDVALLFSHSGRNYDIVALAEELKTHKCPIVVITSYDNSPLAHCADILLTVSPVLNSVISESFSDSLAVGTLINVLYVEVMNRLKETGLQNLAKMRRAIAGRRI